MTLEMRDRVNWEHGKIYGIISVYRERNLLEESIIKILQEKEGLSEESAMEFLEEAEEALKRMNEHRAFSYCSHVACRTWVESGAGL